MDRNKAAVEKYKKESLQKKRQYIDEATNALIPQFYTALALSLWEELPEEMSGDEKEDFIIRLIGRHQKIWEKYASRGVKVMQNDLLRLTHIKFDFKNY